MERDNRSDKYQYRILEVLCPEELWNNFTNQQSISTLLNPWQYDEKVLLLKDQLREEFWIIAKEHCTERQYQVLTMYCGGMTQMEIAKVLNVNQSSITKSLNGNTDYKNGGRVYGGLVKKLKKIVDNDPKIQSIFQRIQELQEEKL